MREKRERENTEIKKNKNNNEAILKVRQQAQDCKQVLNKPAFFQTHAVPASKSSVPLPFRLIHVSRYRMCWPHVKVSKAMYIDYYPLSAESSGYEVMWDFIRDITHRRDFICEKFQS